jgi:hypothetical protein
MRGGARKNAGRNKINPNKKRFRSQSSSVQNCVIKLIP